MKKIVLFILSTILLLCLVSCKEEPVINNENNGNSEEPPKVEAINIILDGNSNFDFLYSSDASECIKSSSKKLIDKINEITGSNFRCYRDNFTREENRKEVLIGKTNRTESIEAYNKLAERSYAIEIVNGCLIIIGYDDTYTSLAVKDFVESVISDSTKCTTGKLIIDTSDCKKVTREEDLSVKEWIELGIKPTVELEQVLRVEKTDKYFITQAACSDGKYIYINFKPRNDNEIKILKYDMNYNLVSESEDLPLGHANGMTYNTKTDEIVVCDCNDKTIFYTVDAKTLTYKNKIQVTEGGGGGGITYSATRDLYAVNNGGSLVNIYDTDFNLVRSFNRTNKNYTNQDCGSDEELIFFELSKAGTDNLIDIYDWDGNPMATVKVNSTVEGESIFSANGKYWIIFYNSMNGFTLYEIKFVYQF